MGVDEDVVAWRRHLHRHPEVSFEEHETAAFVTGKRPISTSPTRTHSCGTSSTPGTLRHLKGSGTFNSRAG